MGYSTPYIVLNIIFLILSVLSFASKKESTQKQWALLSAIVFIVFFAFRGYVQTDTLNYYNLFERLPSIFTQFPDEPDYDTGFLVYMSIIKSIGFSYNHFIFISSVIDLILLTILFRQYFSYKYYAFYFYIFLIFTGFEYEFNLMRNIKSVLLFLISIKYIYSRDFVKFLVLNLIGLTFHWSSIVFIPLYFFIHKELSLKVLCVFFFIGISIYFLMPYLLHPMLKFISNIFQGFTFVEKIETYLELKKYSMGKKFGLVDIISIIWYLLMLISYNRIKETSSYSICFVNLFVICFMFSCMSSGMVIFRQRVAVLFEPAAWVLFVWILKAQNDFKNKLFVFSMIALFGLLIPLRRFKNDILYEYDNILLNENIISIEERTERFQKIKLDKEKELNNKK